MARIAAVPDLERELDELFGLPAADFTKARNDLAGRLRRAHQDDAADQVKALRKPSVVAAAANRLARDEPKLVEALLRAGERLREVQQRALAGSARPQEVSDAAAAERDAVRGLVSAARPLVSSPAALDRLSQTLRAAAVEPRARVLLERGRFTEELKAVGFGPLEAVAPKRRAPDRQEKQAEQARLKELRAEARRLAAEAREAERAAHAARREAEQLEEAAQRARAAAEAAAAKLT